MQELKHLAIIMDGNGRWAQNRGKRRIEGHKMGANVVRTITTWCAQNAISTLTLYAFSTENWKRPKYEVDFLMKMLKNYLDQELETYQKNNIRFFAIGDIDAFSSPLKEKIFEVQEKTSQNNALTQILALNYGGKNELSRAILHNKERISQASNAQEIEKVLEDSLDTRGIPSVDLLLRTGGEQRLSNFLLWQCSYAELFFTPTLWPDFTIVELNAIIDQFLKRHRRFGGL